MAATPRTTYGPTPGVTGDTVVRGVPRGGHDLGRPPAPPRVPDLIRSLETRVDDRRVLYGVGGYPHVADRLDSLLATVRTADGGRRGADAAASPVASGGARPGHHEAVKPLGPDVRQAV